MVSNFRVPLMEKFIIDTTGLVEQLERVAIKIENQKVIDNESIDVIYTIMSSIKASSAMMLFGSISTAADSIKQLFLFIKENRNINYNYIQIIDLVFDVCDYIKSEIVKISNDLEPIGNSQEYQNKVQKLILQFKNLNEDDEDFLEYAYNSIIYFKENCEMEHLRAFCVIHSLKDIGASIISCYPEDYENENSCEAIQKEGFRIKFQTKLSYDNVNKFLRNTAFLEALQLELIE